MFMRKFNIQEQNAMGLNDFHCEDCGDITPYYVKKDDDKKCPDCREVHTLMNTRCRHGMIEIFCGYCMGDVKKRHDKCSTNSPTHITMNSFFSFTVMSEQYKNQSDPVHMDRDWGEHE